MPDDVVTFRFDVDGDDFSSAGAASVEVKKRLRQLGISPDVIRRVAIAMYEGEINMVIHADGGCAVVEVTPDEIIMVLEDHGPGIADVALAMQEGYSTARENIRSLGFGAGMGLPNMKKGRGLTRERISITWRSRPPAVPKAWDIR